MTVFAGIDAGTGGARCLLVDERGRRVAYGERRWTYTPDAHGFPTLEPEAAMDAIRGACRDALAELDPARITGIGVTSQRTGVAFIDAEGRDLMIGPNADGRGAAYGMEAERAHGPLVHRIAGRLPVMLYMPARLAWFREFEKQDVATALPLSDWIVWRLTGATCTEPTQAAELLVYDVSAGRWSDELLDVLEVPSSILPSLLGSGEPAGTVRDTSLGFVEGTPVVPAGADTQCALLALGAIDVRDVTVVAGTTMLVSGVTAPASAEQARGLWRSPLQTGGNVLEAHCGEAGAFLDWFADLLGLDPHSLAELATNGVPGAGGVIAVDPWPGSVEDFVLLRRAELSAPAPVLALGRPRQDVARATIEGVAFGARAGVASLELALGMPRRLFATGGVARSQVFRAALAGAAEGPVRVASEPASSALGAAMMAAAGHHGGVIEAVRIMADPGYDVAPREADGYPTHYTAWRARAAALEADAIRLSGMS
jgi:autoinducer 2 (AI-2) kinase